MMECGKKFWESLRASMKTGRRALAMLLSGAVLLCTLPVTQLSASAAETSNNPGFRVTAYDQSVRVQIPMVSGATNYKVYQSKDSGLTSFSDESCIFNSNTYQAYTYAVNGDKDAADHSKTISIEYTDGGNNNYYFYLVTNDGTGNILKSTAESATRLKDSCYWTSPGVYDSGWYGNGTASTYTVSTAAQLAGLAVLVNGLNGIAPADFSGKTVKLAASIDLSANLWTPIGTADIDTMEMQPFSGTFDGGKNAISGLHTNDSTKNVQGLFGYADGHSTIENAGVVNGDVIGHQYTGSIAGMSEGSIANCYNTGAVSGANDNVGGIAGDAEGTVTNCYNTGTVSGTGEYVGGVVGSSRETITNCYNTGAVSGAGSCVGGITGENGDSIQNCYNTGTISGGGENVGGISGEAYGKATDCYNTGAVSGAGDKVGGIEGYTYYDSDLVNCYNTGAVSGVGDYVGGVTGLNDGSRFTNCYNTGSVSGTGTASQYVGGIAGHNSQKVIESCYNIGAVSGTGDNIGGIVGQDYYATIRNCYSIGSVSGTGGNVGGTVGSITGYTSIVENSYSAGKVNGSEADLYYDSGNDSSSRNKPASFSDKSALLNAVNHDDAFCAAPTAYATGGIFSASNPVNQGYPVLESFGYTDGTSGDGFAPATITEDPDTGDITIGYGDGTSNNPYIIRNAYQMDLVRNYLNTTNSARVFKLASNIDLSPVQYGKTQNADGSWHPIGGYFYGTFDGNGYSISGIYINSGSQLQGLFGDADSGSTIQNVGVTGCNIKGAGCVGGVAGESSGTITGCYNTGSVSSTVYGVGGVVGNADNYSNIENCYNTGSVSGTHDGVGGVAGFDNKEIMNCYNTGSVSGAVGVGGVVGGAVVVTTCYNTGTVSGTSQVGGVAGDSAGAVTGCYNTGAASGTSRVGGVDGYNYYNTVSSCYNTGTASGTSQVGGIVGYSTGTVIRCSNTGAVSGTSQVGGVVGNCVCGTVTSCYNTGSVSGLSDVGGIGGKNEDSITDCYNTGAVSGASDVGGVAGESDRTVTSCYNTGTVSGTGDDVGGVVGATAGETINCYNIGAVSGTSAVGGVVGDLYALVVGCYNAGTVSGTSVVGGVAGYVHNESGIGNCYYSGYSCGVGQNDRASASDVGNGTIPFVSCVNPDLGSFKAIKELEADDLNADFKAAFGITAIQYPDEYESSDTTILTVDGRNVTRVKAGDAAVTGKAGASSNAKIIISQNALDMTDAASGFRGAGTATASGSALVVFTAQQSGGSSAGAPVINTPSMLSTGMVNMPYSQILTASGTSPITWTLESGSLPAGLSLSANGTISGTPTAEGNYSFTVKASNGSGQATVNMSLRIIAFSGGGIPGLSATVTWFKPLGSSVSNRTASVGAAISSLGLPQKLEVIANGINNGYVKVSNWICSTLNSPILSRAGTYTFFPVLDNTHHENGYVDSGYTVAYGIAWPSITVTVQDASSGGHSSNTGSSSSSAASSQKTGTQVDTAANTATVTTVPDSVTNVGGTAQIDVTVPSVTGGTGGSLDTGKAGKVTISLPESAIVQQLNAKQNVDLTLSVPSSVAHQTNGNTAIDIPVGSDVFAAARASGANLVINIRDTDTQQLAYTWTFRGADLAKSTTPVTDVNIGMAIRLTTEVPQVNRLTPDNTGLVLMFDHSGVLPSTASLTFSAKEKGFKPGQKLYFYFYNTSAGRLDSQGQEYTVDADGNVTVQISHCSNYVLLPNKARTITLDTRVYTMPVGCSYITGVKLTGVSGAKLKVYSSTKGVADVTVLSNGNVKAKALKTGLTYVMIDVYDSKNKFLTHASVRLIVKKVVKPNGNSARQFGIF
jgi:hypothetical protein